jgi:hypothetical protein
VLVLQFHALTQIAPSSSHLHPPPPLSLLSKSKSVVIAVWTRELAVVGLLIARWSLLSNPIGFWFPPIKPWLPLSRVLALLLPSTARFLPSAFLPAFPSPNTTLHLVSIVCALLPRPSPNLSVLSPHVCGYQPNPSFYRRTHAPPASSNPCVSLRMSWSD